MKNQTDLVLIDDLRSFKKPRENLLILRSLTPALDWLDTQKSTDVIQELWLDHDLGEQNGVLETIIPFVQKLEERAYFHTAPDIKKVLIHTSNPVGARQIAAALSPHFLIERVDASYFFTI